MTLHTALTTLFFTLGLSASALADTSTPPDTCVPSGQWRIPATNQPTAITDLTARLAQAPVVLLGESHTTRDDHRWQLHMLAALHAHNPNMVIGFESFPRAAQPILDKWIQGLLSEKEFLRAVDWNTVWQFDPSLYMDLFHFARLHRIPMVPMNVERSKISRIRKDGWESVPAEARAPITKPAPALPGYVAVLAEIYAEHMPKAKHGEGKPTPPTMDDKAFKGFVDAQLAWDRAMAQALTDARAGDKSTLVVGIVGRGHLEYGYGIPYQLADLGIKDSAVLLPWHPARPCAELISKDGAPAAAAVFGMAYTPAAITPPKPMLGVMIETAPKDGPAGVIVRQVVPDSVAQKAGLEDGDIISHAAGRRVTKNAALIAIISRQAPGTWLPLQVQRGEATLSIIAKFPTAPPSP